MPLDHWLRSQLYNFGKTITGSSYSRVFKLLQKEQFLSLEDNHHRQQALLSHILKVAYTDTPYYRQLFDSVGLIQPDGSVKLDAWPEIPILTKPDIRKHHQDFINRDIDNRLRIKHFHTGGTTGGDPLSLYADLAYWDWCLAQTHLYYQWMGLDPGKPYIYFWGAPQDFGDQNPDLKTRFWVNALQNRYVLNCRLLSDERMREMIAHLNAHSSHKHIVGYVNELYELARFIQEHRIPITRPFEGILVTTGELTEEMRITIESVFQCPVYNRYGCREAGDIACECQYQNGLHINPLYSYIEVVDDENRPVPPGEEGRILITHLHNELMPLIRYEVGDLGILKPYSSCECGRQWPSFSKITGRIQEYLQLPDGSRVGKIFLNYAFEPFSHVNAFQLHQTDPSTVEIWMVAADPEYEKHHKQEIGEMINLLEEITHNQIRFVIRQVDQLVVSPSGKRLLIVRSDDIPEQDNISLV